MDEHPVDPAPLPLREHPVVRSTASLLLAAGIIEALYGLYNAPPGQIKIEIMFLAAGLLLYFGSTRVIAVMRWILMFAALPTIYMLVQQATIAPLALTMVQTRLYPGQVALFFIPLILIAAVVSVAAWRLNRAPVLAALREHGRTPAGPALPLVLGAAVAIFGSVMLMRMLNGPEARQAADMAAKHHGPNYQYFTNRLHINKGKDTTVYATVQMWNDREVRQVPVQWRK